LRTKFGQLAFSLARPAAWNALPEDLRAPWSGVQKTAKEYSCLMCNDLLWPPCIANADIIFLPCDFYLSSSSSSSSSSFFFFSSPNPSGCRLDDYHTSTHGVALVRI